LSSQLLIDGSELLLIDIDKGDGFGNIKRAFRIYKQSDRKNKNQTSEIYVLKFASEEIILSEHKDYKLLDKTELLNLDWAEADLPIVEEFLKLEL
jgi:hypothetical protein